MTTLHPTSPGQPTIKRLFAHSGNRCAFPRCAEVIVQESTVLGEICHIKAANPAGPRYDPQQTATERHGYDNLILLCGKHHTVIDADEEAYTVERLIKMKADHESRAVGVDDPFAERAALLLLTQSVISMDQSGGITAHTVIFNIHPPSEGLQSHPKVQKQHTLVADIQNTTAARFLSNGNRNSGNIALLFYNLRIVNSLRENVTLKEVALRYSLNGKHFSSESHVLLTGIMPSPDKKENIDAIVVRFGAANIVLMNWKNLRVQIAQNNVLVPGAVLAGSAAFILNFKDANDLAKIKELAISIIDYSGNETVKEIPLEKKWVEQAKRQIVENRHFVIDQAGHVAYSN